MPVHVPEHTQELRCMDCNKWLDEKDLRCGLSQLCADCCLEPANAHGDDDDYAREN